jgi:hypothetical protein
MRMRDVGWVWEGQGIDPGVPPSIFGVGEGAPYFGLTRGVFLFHPNTPLAMGKMAHLDEVVCDISKWKFRWTADNQHQPYADGTVETVLGEAANVGTLSTSFPNITGAIHDDMKGLTEHAGYTPEQYAPIYTALKRDNAALKLWSVVYTHEFQPEAWVGYQPFMDVVNLWVWNANDLPALDEYVDRCRELFPGKPINLGCYLRDYTTAAPVPMNLLKTQWERIPRYLEAGLIDGYSILAAVLIDGHQEQANWVRDFIAAN